MISNDNKQVILDLKEKLQLFEKDYVELKLLNEEKQQQLQDSQREAHNLTGLIRSLDAKLQNARRGMGTISVRLSTAEREQEIIERQNKIATIKEEHPTFLDLVEQHLQELEAKQQQGRKLPLEIEVNTEKFITKLAELDTIEYIKTYGMSPAYELYRETKRAYEIKLEEMIESHLDGTPTSLMFAYEDYVPYAQNFINNANIRTLLSNG